MGEGTTVDSQGEQQGIEKLRRRSHWRVPVCECSQNLYRQPHFVGLNQFSPRLFCGIGAGLSVLTTVYVSSQCGYCIPASHGKCI